MYIVLKYLFFEVYPELLYSNVKKFLNNYLEIRELTTNSIKKALYMITI